MTGPAHHTHWFADKMLASLFSGKPGTRKATKVSRELTTTPIISQSSRSYPLMPTILVRTHIRAATKHRPKKKSSHSSTRLRMTNPCILCSYDSNDDSRQDISMKTMCQLGNSRLLAAENSKVVQVTTQSLAAGTSEHPCHKSPSIAPILWASHKPNRTG